MWAGAPSDDLDAGGAEASGAATAVHGGVADADDQDPGRGLRDMAKVDGAEPLDTDVDDFAGIALMASREVEFLTLRRAAADKHGVVTFRQQCLHGVDRRVVTDVDTHIEDVAGFFVQHRGR